MILSFLSAENETCRRDLLLIHPASDVSRLSQATQNSIPALLLSSTIKNASDWGYAHSDFKTANESFGRFLGWVEERLDPAALQNSQSSCAVCMGANPPEFTPLEERSKIP